VLASDFELFLWKKGKENGLFVMGNTLLVLNFIENILGICHFDEGEIT
jgi:hypothetical protein